MKKGFTWMMAAIQLLMLTVGICGTTVLSSCSSDDDYSSDMKVSFQPAWQETVNDILQRTKAEMEAADFKDLTSLADALRNGTAEVNWTGTDGVGGQQVVASLQSLLDSFFDSENPRTFNRAWQVSNLSKSLQLALNVGIAFEKVADNRYSGNRNYSGSFNVVVNDTLNYNIALSTEKSTGVWLAGISNMAHRKLVIGKNGATVLVINTSQNLDASVDAFLIDATRLNACSLEYNDMKFSLERTQYNIDSAVTNLAYSVEGLELIGIKCDVDNMNKFYQTGLGLLGIAIAGSSKESCQKLTDIFNAAASSKLSLFGEEQGLVILEPVASDSLPNVYRPELFLQTFPLGEDSEKIRLKELLDMMGIALDNIVNIFIGPNNK
jgi:hypothetical protein